MTQIYDSLEASFYSTENNFIAHNSNIHKVTP